MSASTPCESDPDKWFIDRDGLKYDDEVLVGEVELNAAMAQRPDPEDLEDAEIILDALLADKVKARLVERRHARDECHTVCKVRTLCLQKALDNQEQYGIWGGYFPEQRRQLEREIEARRLRKLGSVG